MSLPTVNDVQAVEPVLTNMLVGYAQADNRFVASRVFPITPVDKDSGTYYSFTKKYWFLDEMKRRAPGAPFEDGNIGVGTATYTTVQWAIQHPIADEIRKNSQVPMDLEEAAVKWLGQQSLIRKERAFSTDFMITGVWGTDDNNATTDWDDNAAGDPVNDVLTARRTISNATGQLANTLVCGAIVDQALLQHPDILDRIKYVQAATAGNVAAALADVFGLKNYWPSYASYNSANEGAAMTAAAIVDDDALICYVDPAAGLFSASAGKTFVWAPGGGQGTIYRVRDDINHRDLIQLNEQWDQVAVATDVGYFFADVV